MAEGAPSATTGALWDFNNGAGSQALGTISTGSVNSRFGAIIQNTTGGTLTQFTLSYTGEEWWEGTSAASSQALNFDYGTFSSLPTFPTAASPSGYTSDTNLTFNPPKNGTQGALSGTLAANQVANIHDTVTGLSWANNTYLVIYWQSANTGSVDGMGITNVNFSAKTAVTAPAVNTPTVSAITGSSATLGANVASDGGSPITERGVVYALTSADNNPHVADGTAIEVDASGTTGVFTVQTTGLSGLSSYTFEAFATNSIGTTYSAPTTFTTAAPGVITSWTFPATAGAGDNSPAPTFGTGTATTLGMTNTYNGGNTASDDVTSTAGTANPNFTENLWRIRGAQTPAGNNGWATYQNGAGAPEYSQGIELDTSTVGYSNIVFSFNWYSTTQGIRDLQVQYNTGSGWVNYQGPSPTGTFVTGGNDYYNSVLSPVNPTIHIDLSGVAAANNNPDLGIRLVSAFDSTGTLVNSMGIPDEYASAASTAGDIIPYNNNSGNWRFGNLTFAAGVTTTTALTANPPLGQSPGQNVTFTATVTPAGGSQYASGSVAFYDGVNLIGTQNVSQVGTTNVGTASITLNSLSPGVHGDITAQYTPSPGNGLIASGSSMNLVAGDPTDNPISYTINAPQATGVDISPVVGQPFTGVVATFSDGTYTDPTGFTAQITWASGQTTTGNIAFLGTNDQTNINGQIVDVSLFSVTGTYTYTSAGSYPISILITDPNSNTATVNPTARVAYAPLVVAAGPAINAVAGVPLSSVTVATFTDPGLVAALGTSNLGNLESQFTASINWDDGSPADTGTITYNSGGFSVTGSHTYSQTGPYSISVIVTPLTVSVERIDSSDPTNRNLVGDENGNTLTDSPSPDFIDQFSIGATNQTGALYTTSLPTVSSTGNVAFTNSSYSVSEGEMTLSTNGQYLVTGGYNATVSAWAPQQTFSPASVLNRVIATVNGAGVINTTTNLTDAYSGDNFRGVVSTDGTQFWTSGHSGDSSDFVHFAQLGAGTSTILTSPNGAANVNTVEIFNGQLYDGVRSGSAGIYQVGTGLPTAAGQPETLFIPVPQTNPLDITSGNKPMSPFDFYMADLPSNPNSINGVNVAYVADGEMGILRYDYTSSGWQFSYYIDSTGSFKDNTYTVDGSGDVTPTASFDSTNPIPASNPNSDPNKAGGVKGLTGRVVDGQVELFATTAFGTGSQPDPGEKLIEVTDTGADAGFTTLATDSGASELTSVAFTPFQSVTSAAQVISVTNPGTQNSADGDNVSLPIVASGLPAGDSWTYTATGLPATLSIDTGTGVISGKVTDAANAYTVTVTASDGQGGNASQSFTWNVSTLSVTNPGTQNNADGDTVSLPISASGLPTGDTWTYTATGLPASLTINTGTGVISGTVTDAANAYTVLVTASDGQGASASQTFTWNVSTLSVTNPGTQNSADGDTVSLPISASGLPAGDTWTYTAIGLPASLTINTGTGVISGTVTDSANAYTVLVTASDGQGASASQNFTWNVSTLSVTNPGTQNNADGDSVSLQISASGLPAGDTWTYSAIGLPASLSINSGTGVISGTVTDAAKAYTVMVSASDGQGASASQSFTWNVSTLSVTNPGTQNNADGDTVSLPISASGLPTGDTWTYSAIGLPASLSINSGTGLISGTVTDTAKAYTVMVSASDGQGASASQSFTWNVSTLSVTNPGTQNNADGDSVSLPILASGLPSGDTWSYSATGLPASLTINTGTGVISGTVTDAAKAYTVMVTASDGQGASASQTFTWNVSTLSVANPGTQNSADGDTVSLAIQASGLPTGDTWAYSATGLPSGLTINTGTGVISGMVTAAANAYTVKVTASDGHGGSASQSFTWNVSLLSITNPGTKSYVVGNTVSLPIQASGLPAGDTWTFSATGLPAGLAINAGTGVIGGTITAAPNNYSVTVKASDGNGGSASQTFTIAVNLASLEPDPLDPTKTDLFVGGTSTSNHIEVELNKKLIVVEFNNSSSFSTPLSGLNALVVYGQAKNQEITVDNNVTLPAFLFTGDGPNAHIEAGGGPTVEVGGSGGNDHLEGGPMRDILIAGKGGGHLESHGGDDILIGGYTDYDHNLAALESIMAEWNSAGSYNVRTAVLSAQLNANTVHDDGVSDHLDGGAGRDWYFAKLAGAHKDDLDGVANNEILVGIH